MKYTAEHLQQMRANHDKVVADLQSLMLKGMSESQPLTSEPARRHLQQGVGRRLGVLKKSIQRIFEIFAPSQTEPLDREALADVQIYLHAFVINLSGIFDNWAWAFLFRHDLARSIDRRSVGLFKSETQRLMPGTLRDYLASQQISSWHTQYLKNYRDALAHRIPLYIPPAAWTKDDETRYKEIEAEKTECIGRGEWDRLDTIWAEQDKLGKACPVFLHDFSDDESSTSIFLHPQVLNDGVTVTDFGNKFYAAWHQRA